MVKESVLSSCELHGSVNHFVSFCRGQHLLLRSTTTIIVVCPQSSQTSRPAYGRFHARDWIVFMRGVKILLPKCLRQLNMDYIPFQDSYLYEPILFTVGRLWE